MPRGSKPGERRGGRRRGTPNKKTALVEAAFDAATSNADLSPLDFLLGVMRDSSLSPDLRMKAAQAAAPYVHPKAGGTPATDPMADAKPINGVCDFVIDPRVARTLMDDRERLRQLGRKKLDCDPATSAEEKEESDLRARIAETARGITCPANYGLKEAEKDRHRLECFFLRRQSGASAKPLSEAEIAEEAQLAARVAAYNEGPECRARSRLFELTLKGFPRGLSGAEAEELERLQKAYPPDPNHQFKDALEACRRALADERDRIERLKAGSKRQNVIHGDLPVKRELPASNHLLPDD